MSLIRWNPYNDPFAEVEEFFNAVPAVAGHSMKSFVPAVNVYETDKAVVIETPLAGVNPEDLEVSVEKGVLTIKGETKKEHEVEEKNYYRKEVRSGTFYRQIPLPAAVDEHAVTAEFENGLLKIAAPKVGQSTPKKISVKIAKK